MSAANISLPKSSISGVKSSAPKSVAFGATDIKEFGGTPLDESQLPPSEPPPAPKTKPAPKPAKHWSTPQSGIITKTGA